MTTDAQSGAEITGQGPHVRARRDLDLDVAVEHVLPIGEVHGAHLPDLEA